MGNDVKYVSHDVRVLHSGTGSIFYEKLNNKQWVNHREDGPAITFQNGNKFWYINGNLHRMDGPACEYKDGPGKYYIHGKIHSEMGFFIRTSKLGRILFG